MFSFSGK